MPGCWALKGVQEDKQLKRFRICKASPIRTRYATDARGAVNAYAQHDGNAWNVMILSFS